MEIVRTRTLALFVVGALARAAASVPGQTKIVADSAGKVLAAAPPSAAAIGSDVTARGPHVRAALAGRISVVAVKRGGEPRIELAFPLETAHGRRVSVTVLPRALVDSFLGGYLRRLLTADTDEAYVVDSSGDIVAGAGPVGAASGAAAATGSTRARPCRRRICASCC